VKIAQPRLTVEAAVSNGVVKAVRCKAEVEAGVGMVFIGVAEEAADVRLKTEVKPAEAGKPYAKTAEEPKPAGLRVEKIQLEEETKATERRLEVERQAEAGYSAVGGVEVAVERSRTPNPNGDPY